MRRGEIYLVNFGKRYNSEFGKIRPALIIQNDIANRTIDRVAFKGVSVLPLTTRLSEGRLRVRIESRDDLHHTSDICINEICTLDLSRIDLSRRLTVLTADELDEVSEKLRQHLSL